MHESSHAIFPLTAAAAKSTTKKLVDHTEKLVANAHEPRYMAGDGSTHPQLLVTGAAAGAVGAAARQLAVSPQ